MMLKIRLLIATLCLLTMGVVVGEVSAEFQPTFLGSVASQFAQRPVTVVCRTRAEDLGLNWAWGYVYWPPSWPYTTYLDEYVCLGALAIDLDVPEVTDGQKVLGLVVLVHEAFHLRPIPNARSEKVTECRAFQNYDLALQALGAEPEVVNRLMPRAIARHYYFVRRIPEYDLKTCKLPARYKQYIGP